MRRTDSADISAAAQEYLLALRVMGSEGRVATSAQLGRHVGVSTQAAARCAGGWPPTGSSSRPPAAGLVLTTAGRTAADAIFRRHALLEWLLTSVVGLSWAESDVEAMRLQGALSPRVESKLDELLGHPETCPHGNPIDLETALGAPPACRSPSWSPGRGPRSCGSPRRPRRIPDCSRTWRHGRSPPARTSPSWRGPSRWTRSRSTVRADGRRSGSGRPR